MDSGFLQTLLCSKDQQVILKKAYNDERCNRSAAERHSSGQAFQQGQHLSGAAWYSQGAFRALNQAIGELHLHPTYASVLSPRISLPPCNI